MQPFDFKFYHDFIKHSKFNGVVGSKIIGLMEDVVISTPFYGQNCHKIIFAILEKLIEDETVNFRARDLANDLLNSYLELTKLGGKSIHRHSKRCISITKESPL